MEINEVKKQLTAPYYTRQNLELILGSNRRTLDYRIKKLIDEEVLTTLKPGFYLNQQLLSQSQAKEELLEYVGNIAKYPSYVSLEYALSKYGLIAESIFTITYITTKKTADYSSKFISYRYQNIKPELFTGYEARFIDGKKYLFALKTKALFDFIYLVPLRNKADYEQLLLNSRFNWTNLTSLDKKQFKLFCQQAQSKKMDQVIKFLQEKELI